MKNITNETCQKYFINSLKYYQMAYYKQSLSTSRTNVLDQNKTL